MPRNNLPAVSTTLLCLTLAVLMASGLGCDATVMDETNEARSTTNPRTGLISPEFYTLAEDWDYSDGANGPAHWPELFEQCAGQGQSPIDLQTPPFFDSFFQQLRGDRFAGDHGLRSTPLRDLPGHPPLRFDYTVENELDVFNNTYTVEAEIHDPTWTLTVGGATYTLLQFHFHTQSEHLLDGTAFPLEMHLVHRSEDGALAVVGIFIEAGEENEELAKIWADLPGVDDTETIPVHDFDLALVLPRNRENFRYSGSLTTPPCSEGVNWFVMKTPIEMSQAQLGAIAAIFSDTGAFPDGNRRPTQPLNGRYVPISRF